MKIQKSSVLYDEAVLTIEGVYRASCTMCPFSEDFQKIYGMKPYDYYPMKNVVKEVEKAKDKKKEKEMTSK
ncbi:MAG: hypothetical protein EPN93_09950 [Spirochaetes bacterium]|nr:MAG: hypothetical protein EPN93_09950 [Spirochaetota bacterium]